MIAKSSSLLSTRTSRAVRPSRASVAVQANANRQLWYPGATAPSHLDGSYVGDFGFDPLRLGTKPEVLKWYREAELTNGRWAMAGVAGILFTDALGLGNWWEAGAKEYAIPTGALVAIELLVFAILEGKRYEGYKKTGETGFLAFFPFDPLNLRSEENKLKELKNGRLAMIAFVGFSSQAAIYGKGPLETLQLHLDDPEHNNIYTTVVGPETAVTAAVLSVWPMILEATKTLNKSGKESVPYFPWNEPWKQQ